MIRVSALPYLLTHERHRQRASSKGELSVPMLMERSVLPVDEPLMSSNSKGNFLKTSPSRESVARYAFFKCLVEDEPNVVQGLYNSIEVTSKVEGWGCTVNSLTTAFKRFDAYGCVPYAVVLPNLDIASVCGQDLPDTAIEALMLTQGHVAMLDGLRVLAAPLHAGQALVVTNPQTVGVYTRVGDYLGIQLCNVKRNVALVQS